MHKNRKAAWVAALGWGFLIVANVGAAAVSINPSKDAFVTTGPSNNLSDNNYGAAGALGISGSSASNGPFASLISFDLSSVRSSFDTTYGAGLWTVQSIAIQLTTTSPNNAIFNAQSAGQFSVVWMQNDSWTEGSGTPNAPTTSGITYASLPSFLGANDQSLGTFAFNATTSGTSVTYTLGTASGILADIAGGNVATIELLAATSNVSYLLSSRTAPTGSSRPLLTVTAAAVPEPSEWFIAGACCGLLALSRKFRLRHERKG